MKPVKVSQLNKYIKTILQTDPLLSNISVVGEISNLKYHGSGHVYFSMKDSGGRINCFLAADKAAALRYPLEEGLEIVASGYIYLYEKGGSYSLNISRITVEGEGNLAAAFARLKEKLDKEGLFDQKYKRPLPTFPERVGLVTSATGAAVWDMIRTIKNKNNYVDIILCPCLVQGDGAAADIDAAIAAMNRMDNPPDVLIVGRGGGSGEDLWAFNEERLVRSIFSSEIPIISAVGHETDFTIADFVADYRAATPTAAAEAAVPDIRELREEMFGIISDMKYNLNRNLTLMEGYVNNYSPDRMSGAIEKRISGYENRLDNIMNSMMMSLKETLHREELKIEKIKILVDSRNPMKILDLGFGIVTGEDNKYIKSVSSVGLGDRIKVMLSDGSLSCLVEKKEN